MNFSFNTALLTGLALAFVTLFALGFYWLAIRRRFTRSHSPFVPPPVRSAAVRRPTFDFDQLDEGEPFAPYPDRLLRAMQEANAEPPDACDRFDRPVEPAHAPHKSAVLHELHDALELPARDFAAPEPSSAEARFDPAPPASKPPIRCPSCLSSRIDTRNRARKAGSTIGSVAGATGGMAAALAGAETGAVVGSIAGPIGSVFGGLAGAVIAGLVGSAAGCAAGSAVGGAIDDAVLDTHVCLACGHAFSVKQAA